MTNNQRSFNAIKAVIQNEGGYVNHPADPGGETKYGITKRTYPYLDIRNLTMDDAIKIYQKDWWDKYGFGNLPLGVGEKIFDLSVNMGAQRPVRFLQRALCDLGQDVTIDGILGPKTCAAAIQCHPRTLVQHIKYHARNYYTALAERRPKMRVFLKGWLKRLET